VGDRAEGERVRTILLLLADVSASTGAHISLKRSAAARGAKLFLLWQVVGNLAGFVGVLAYTAVMRGGISLRVAYPLTEGLTAVGVQLVGGMIVFREKIPTVTWVGTGLILSGIVMFSL
jgi:multidrug transporter EmrE-like cation transporter